MVIAEIQLDIDTVEGNPALYEETNFGARADAIDFIDFHIINRIDGLLQRNELTENLYTLKQHAEKLKHRLEKVDINLFKQLRANIGAGNYPPSSFRQILRKYLQNVPYNTDKSGTAGYDNFDAFINGLLCSQLLPEATVIREPEMVFYQQTPARIIFEMAELARFKADDVFFDLGSGLGQVIILMNLINGVTAKGIEYEPAYCNYAKTCAAQLNLANIEFINTDACKGDYSAGTVFFMYTPFVGNMLQNILGLLQKQAKNRAIKLFTYGPCSANVAGQSWLNCVNGPAADTYKLYEFISL